MWSTRRAPLVAMLLLAACSSTAPRREASVVAEQLRLAGQRQDACYAALRGDPVMARVSAYMVADASDPEKARKTGDRRTATGAMRRDLVRARQKVGECRAVSRDGFGAVDPAYVRILELTHGAEDDVLLAMLNRRIRVGAANQRFLGIDALSDAAWDATTGSITTRADDTEAADKLRREVAAAALRRLEDERRKLAELNPAGSGACRLAGTEIDCGSS